MFYLACERNIDNEIEHSPKMSKRTSERIMFYNVENLFDTIDDPHKADNEFLPTGKKEWNSQKYFKKLNQIGKVIIAVGEWKAPAIIGLCEIENRTVLNDLVNNSPLQKMQYQIVHHESPDPRGIDVALLYNAKKFRVLSDSALTIRKRDSSLARTRDILYVQGILEKDTIHIYVNHWSSRRGGQMATEQKRINGANTLRKHLDGVFSKNTNAKVLIMGDFNDEPDNKSVYDVLVKGELYNAMFNKISVSAGTNRYRNKWNMLDQIILSNTLKRKMSEAEIFKRDWLFSEDKNGERKNLFRTYQGPIYKGGYSDHLPVYIDFL